MRKTLFNETSSPRLIAHRGFTPLAPENSLPAFEAAGRLGFWAIESDVHETRDGALVCCHNPDTENRFNAALSIAESTLSELRRLRFTSGNRVELLDDDELLLPTFEEYLAICRKYGAVPFLESKAPVAGKILAALRKYDLIHHAVFSSTEFSHLEEARSIDPNIFLHHIFTTREQLERLAELGNGGVSWNYPDPASAPPERIAETKKHCVRVCLRAADSPERLRIMIDLKLDYIPTNILIPKGGK